MAVAHGRLLVVGYLVACILTAAWLQRWVPGAYMARRSGRRLPPVGPAARQPPRCYPAGPSWFFDENLAPLCVSSSHGCA